MLSLRVIASISKLGIVPLVQSFRFDVAPEDIPLEEVGNLAETVCRVDVGRHAEHLIQFFESLALGLRHEQEDQHETDEVPRRVPGECPLRFESRKHPWPGDGEDEVEEPGGSRCQTHAVSTYIQRVRFGRVCERDRTFTGRVNHGEEIDAEGNAGDSGRFVRDPEAESGEEQEE